jgi:FtsP/CotA-like multicopper oxidase with cupredoxin domain
MDGVVGVTQCGIPPGSSFIYNFTIPNHQHGTFWYHAHSGLTRADGLYGGLIVHEPASKSTVRDLLATSALYSKEYLLLIGDWYHRPAEEVMSWYMRAGSFGNDVCCCPSSFIERRTDIMQPVPDSLLINGIGHYNCSMAVPARPVDCVEQHADLTYLHTEVNTAYRLRIVNTG